MRGFTLIELLVVVLIIALGVSIVGLNVGDDGNRQLQLDAKQFANQSALLAEEAVLSNRLWGIDLYRYSDDDGNERFGYRWLVRADDEIWEQPLDEDLAREYAFAAGLGIRLQVDGLEAETDIEYRQEVPVQQQDGLRAKSAVNVGNREGSQRRDKQKVEPEIWLLSSGEMNAFVLTVYNQLDPAAAVTVRGDELGRVQLDRGDSDEADI